jgi:hypothetical protein
VTFILGSPKTLAIELALQQFDENIPFLTLVIDQKPISTFSYSELDLDTTESNRNPKGQGLHISLIYNKLDYDILLLNGNQLFDTHLPECISFTNLMIRIFKIENLVNQ